LGSSVITESITPPTPIRRPCGAVSSYALVRLLVVFPGSGPFCLARIFSLATIMKSR